MHLLNGIRYNILFQCHRELYLGEIDIFRNSSQTDFGVLGVILGGLGVQMTPRRPADQGYASRYICDISGASNVLCTLSSDDEPSVADRIHCSLSSITC